MDGCWEFERINVVLKVIACTVSFSIRGNETLLPPCAQTLKTLPSKTHLALLLSLCRSKTDRGRTVNPEILPTCFLSPSQRLSSLFPLPFLPCCITVQAATISRESRLDAVFSDQPPPSDLRSASVAPDLHSTTWWPTSQPYTDLVTLFSLPCRCRSR